MEEIAVKKDIKFYPALQNTRLNVNAGVLGYSTTTNYQELIKHLHFTNKNILPEVPANLIYAETITDSHFEIHINVADYIAQDKIWENFNWKNCNYFMSNYNYIDNDFKQSFWNVVESQLAIKNGEIAQVIYKLELDEWTTYFEYLWNAKGVAEVKSMHNKRFSPAPKLYQNKNNNAFAIDFYSNPSMQNCNQVCARYNELVEIQNPELVYDSKHYNYDGTPNPSPDFFEVDADGNVVKQVKAWIVVFCDKDESGKHTISLIDEVVIPYKIFLFGIWDTQVNHSDYASGLEKIQNPVDGKGGLGYRIATSTAITDLFDYKDLKLSEAGVGWYESTSNVFHNNISNGIIFKPELFEKFVFTQDEIINTMIEPHLMSATHTQYELTNIMKQPILFSFIQCIYNLQNSKPPTITLVPDKPLFSVNDTFKKCFGEGRKVCAYKFDNDLHIQNGNGKTYHCPWKEGMKMTDLVELWEEDADSWKDGVPGYTRQNCNYPGIWGAGGYEGTANNTFIDRMLGKNRGEGISGCIGPHNVVYHNLSSGKVATGGCSIPQTNVSANISTIILGEPFRWPFFDSTLSLGELEIRVGYNESELENPGNYNNTVIGYNITAYVNGKYLAENWYVLIGNDVYEFPIGKLLPTQMNVYSSNYFYSDNKSVIITKNISFFSVERVGYKNVLLDTKDSFQRKLEENKSVLAVDGAYRYPYFSNTYTDDMKTQSNQRQAGYDNANLKYAGDRTQAITSGITGLLGGLIGAGAGIASGNVMGAAGGLSNMISGVGDLSNGLINAKVNRQIALNSLNAKYADLKNSPDNIGVQGMSETTNDLILKKVLQLFGKYNGYWNFWTMLIHKMELNPVDAKSVMWYFNKFGYAQDRMYEIKSLKDLCVRYLWNYLIVVNFMEIWSENGLNPLQYIRIAGMFQSGIFLVNLDNQDYKDIMDFTRNNYEEEFYEAPDQLEGLEISLEGELG